MGILSLCLVFGLMVTGCEKDDPAPADPEITGFIFTATASLQVGNANVAAGATAGTLSAPVGGTQPFTYTLSAGTGDTDNASFQIDGTNLKVGATALTTAKTYSVRIKATDTKGKTLEQPWTIAVAAAAGPAPGSGKPTVTAVPSVLKILVSWTEVTGASNYQVVWARAETVPATLNANNSIELTATNKAHSITTIADTYGVWVRAKKDGTYGDYSDKQTVTVPGQAGDNEPDTPAAPTVTATADGQLQIVWTDTRWAETYSIEIATTNQQRGATAYAPSQAEIARLTYKTTINALPVGTEYYVWLGAGNNGNNGTTKWSAPVGPVPITQAPADPTALHSTTWKNEVTDAKYVFASSSGGNGDGSVVYTPATGGGGPSSGTFTYAKPTLRLTITTIAAGFTALAEWNGTAITVYGKTFTVGNDTFILQP